MRFWTFAFLLAYCNDKYDVMVSISKSLQLVEFTISGVCCGTVALADCDDGDHTIRILLFDCLHVLHRIMYRTTVPVSIMSRVNFCFISLGVIWESKRYNAQHQQSTRTTQTSLRLLVELVAS